MLYVHLFEGGTGLSITSKRRKPSGNTGQYSLFLRRLAVFGVLLKKLEGRKATES